MRQSPGEIRGRLSGALSLEVTKMYLFLSATVCNKTCEVLSVKEDSSVFDGQLQASGTCVAVLTEPPRGKSGTQQSVFILVLQ